MPWWIISTIGKLHVFQPSPDRLFIPLAPQPGHHRRPVLNWISRDLEPSSA